MAIYTIKNLDSLVKKINSMPKVSKKALKNTVNKSATFSIKESVNEITQENNLSPSYVKSKFDLVARASDDNLRAIVRANDRRTLMSRYPFTQSKKGVSVAVKRGSRKLISRAKILRLKNGNGVGIALRNKDYFRYLKTDTPQLSTKRPAKLTKALNKAINKPLGWHVLHAASIDQMFKKVRENIQPQLHRFMVKEYLEQFKRLSK